MKLRFTIYATVAIFALSFFAIPGVAHHGWGGNLDEEFEITGVVTTGVSLAGPHATMKIRAQDKIWDITLAPPAATDRAGLKEGIIPVGATVMIHGHRNRDPKKYEIKGERVTWNGRTFNVYPDRTYRRSEFVRLSALAAVLGAGPGDAEPRRVGIRRGEPGAHPRSVVALRLGDGAGS